VPRAGRSRGPGESPIVRKHHRFFELVLDCLLHRNDQVHQPLGVQHALLAEEWGLGTEFHGNRLFEIRIQILDGSDDDRLQPFRESGTVHDYSSISAAPDSQRQ
jgi:hypothetical protein